MQMIKNILKLSIGLILLCGCKKLIETDLPVDQIPTIEVFQNDESALAALSNVYYTFNTYIAGNYNTNVGLYTDELIYNSSQTAIQEFMNANISVDNGTNLNIWRYLYSVVYQSNMIIEQLKGTAITKAVAAKVQGESLFLRSFSYFYLTQIYGDVPLILSTEVKETSVKAKDAQIDIMNQIEKDLQAAENLLTEDYPSGERARVNKVCAKALLSRVYLYNKKYKEARDKSTEVITDPNYALENLDNTFRKGSRETILQFWILEGYTRLGRNYLPLSGVPPYLLPSNFQSLFEENDQRLKKWTATSNNGVQVSKYKQNNTSSGSSQEYFIALRLAEQYLIRGEAQANLGAFELSKQDIDSIRQRAGLMGYKGVLSYENIMQEIERQRHLEYFNEWGDRLFDLRRLGHLNSVMQTNKTGWESYRSYFPIPANEIRNNPNLIQTKGY